MISHTCFTPPTGVPVEVITHCAWLVGPLLGTSSELPAGHAVPPGPGNDGAGGAAVAVLAMPAPERASSPTDAVTITPLRTRCRRNLCRMRTRSSSRRAETLRSEQGIAVNLRSAGYAEDDVAQHATYFCVNGPRTRSRTRVVACALHPTRRVAPVIALSLDARRVPCRGCGSCCEPRSAPASARTDRVREAPRFRWR